jgi:hypothetical protein
MEIYLSKPGGQRQGPYTLEQINRDLVARKYGDTDYWAWREGLSEWVPLYSLPGIAVAAEAPAPEPPKPVQKLTQPPLKSELASRPAPAAGATASKAPPRPLRPEVEAKQISIQSAAPHREPGSAMAAVKEANAVGALAESAAPVLEEERASVSDQISSGMPATALEQVFAFTTSDGPTAWQSPMVAQMLKKIIGENLAALREAVPRDVVGECSLGELLKSDGSVSDAVWCTMEARRPELVQRAKARLCRVCVRTFRIEGDAIMALILFYDKQRL